jgi:hypothetical protein
MGASWAGSARTLAPISAVWASARGAGRNYRGGQASSERLDYADLLTADTSGIGD